MKKIQVLTATAGILLALAGPSLAAQRTHRADPAQTDLMDSVRRDYYSVYGNPGFNSYARGESQSYQVAPAQTYPSHNLPYPDRPWGDPDRY